MFTPSSSWRVHLLVHVVLGFFFSFLLFFSSIAAKRTSTKSERGLTKRSWNWPKTYDYFLASEKGRNLLLRIVMSSLFPKHMLSWAAVCPGSPSVNLGNTLNVTPSPFHQRNQIFYQIFPSQLKMDMLGTVELAQASLSLNIKAPHFL